MTQDNPKLTVTDDIEEFLSLVLERLVQDFNTKPDDFNARVNLQFRDLIPKIITALQTKQRLEEKISYLKSLPDYQITSGETNNQKIFHMLERLLKGDSMN